MSNQMVNDSDQQQRAHKLPKSSKIKHSNSSDLQQRRFSLDSYSSKMDNPHNSAEKEINESIDDKNRKLKLHKRSDSMQNIRSHSSSKKIDNIFNHNSLMGVGEVKNQMIFAKVAKELDIKSEELERLKQELQQKDDEVQLGQLKTIENKLLKGDLNYQESVIKDLEKKLRSVLKVSKQNNNNSISSEIQENIMALIQENEQLFKQNQKLSKECIKQQEKVKKLKVSEKNLTPSKCNNCSKDLQKLSVSREQLTDFHKKIDFLSQSQSDAEKTIQDYEDKVKAYKAQLIHLQEKENKEREQIKIEMNKLKQELEYYAGLELKRQGEIEKLINIIQMKDQIEVEQQKTRNEVEKLHQEILQKSQQVELQREILQKNEESVKNKDELINHLKSLNEQIKKEISEEMKEELEKLKREKNSILQESSRYQEYSDKLESQLITTKEDLKKVNSLLIEKQQQILSQQETFREEKNKDLAELSKIQIELQKEVNNLQQEKELLSLEREKYKNEKNQLMSENKSIQKEYENIIQQNKLLLNEKQDLILERQQLQQDKQQLQQEKQQLLSEKQQLQQEKQQLQLEKVSIHSEKSNLLREKQQLIGERESLQQEKKSLISEKEQLQNQKKILSQQNQAISREKMLTLEENKQLLTKRNDDQIKLKKLSEEINNLQQENSKLIDEGIKSSQRQSLQHLPDILNSQSTSSLHALKSQFEQLLREKQNHLEEKIKEVSRLKQLLDDKEIELNEANQNFKQIKEQQVDNTVNTEKIKQLAQENSILDTKLKNIQDSVEVYKKKALLCEEQEKTISNLLSEHQKLQFNYKQLVNTNQQVQLSSNFNLYHSNSTEDTKQACTSLQTTIQTLQERVKVCEALIEEKKKEIDDFKNTSYFPLLEEQSNYKQQINQQKVLIQQLENAFLMREKDFQKQMKKMQIQIEKENKEIQNNKQYQSQRKQENQNIQQINKNLVDQQLVKIPSVDNNNNSNLNLNYNQSAQSTSQLQFNSNEQSLKRKLSNSSSSLKDEGDLTNLICKSAYDSYTSDKQERGGYSTCLNFNDRMILKKEDSAQNSSIRNNSRENSSQKLNEQQISQNNLLYNSLDKGDNILDIQDYQSQQIQQQRLNRNSSNSSTQHLDNQQQPIKSQLSRNPSNSLISNKDLIKDHHLRSSRLQTSSTSLKRSDSNSLGRDTSYQQIPYPSQSNSQKQLHLISRNTSNSKIPTCTSRENNVNKIITNSSNQHSLSASRSFSRDKSNTDLRLSIQDNNQKNQQDQFTTYNSSKRNSIDISQQQYINPNKSSSLVSMLREKVANISLSNKKQPLKQISSSSSINQSNKTLITIPKPNPSLNTYDYQNQTTQSTLIYNNLKNQATEQSQSYNSNNINYDSQINRTFNTIQDENQIQPHHPFAPANKRNSSNKRSNQNLITKGYYSNVSAFDFSQYTQ